MPAIEPGILLIPATVPRVLPCPRCGGLDRARIVYVEIEIAQHEYVATLIVPCATIRVYMPDHDVEMTYDQLLDAAISEMYQRCPELDFQRDKASLGRLTYLCGSCAELALDCLPDYVTYAYQPTGGTDHA